MRTGARGTDLSYRVLGPLQVRHGDRPVRLADDRQQRLLALLLLGANRPVLARTIIDQLFADASGRPPYAAVWGEVSALGARLSVDGRETPITSRPGGYVLAVAPEQLDAHRFERLVADGRALERDRRTAQAAAVLREALGLWQGDPLCDLPEAEFAQAEIERLRGLRREAEELMRELEPGPALPTPQAMVPVARESATTEPAAEREADLPELIARAVAGELVGLVGPPGVDRSSVLRAEVPPMLSAAAPPGSARWRQILIRPGATPVASLEQALGGPLVDVLIAMPTGERLVIAVDPLEELLADAVDEAERTRFLDLLVIAVSDPARRAIVVVTVDAEQRDHFAEHSRFAQRLSAAHHLLGPASSADLRPVLEVPAEQGGDAPPAVAVPAGPGLAPTRPATRRPSVSVGLAVLLLGLLILGGAVAMASEDLFHGGAPKAQRAQRAGSVASARPGTRVSVKRVPRPAERSPQPGGSATGTSSSCISDGCGD
jgi:Bacterial transcriptional activator domain